MLYRRDPDGPRVLLIHPGGPFWRGKDAGAWMIPKGELRPGEQALEAALREYEEELGSAPQGHPEPLCAVRQSGGKLVEAFALEGFRSRRARQQPLYHRISAEDRPHGLLSRGRRGALVHL